MRGPIRYAVNGDVHIAYQTVGDGPVDLVHTSGIWSNLDIMWEWPAWASYLEQLASFSRLVLFDMRGIGLSDRGTGPPILELQAEDLRAVMDAAGCETAAIYGGARGAAMTMLFAATWPERVRALVLYAPVAKTVRSPDWPYGKSEEEQRRFYERFVAEMGTAQNLDLQGPSYDQAFKRWWGRLERLVATPGAYRELGGILTGIDVRNVLPLIQAPTLILHRAGDRIVPVDQVRAVAERIPGAHYVELPGIDHIPFLGDWNSLVGEIQEFLMGARTPREPSAPPGRVPWNRAGHGWRRVHGDLRRSGQGGPVRRGDHRLGAGTRPGRPGRHPRGRVRADAGWARGDRAAHRLAGRRVGRSRRDRSLEHRP